MFVSTCIPPPLKHLKSFKTLIRGINSPVVGDWNELSGIGLLGVKRGLVHTLLS